MATASKKLIEVYIDLLNLLECPVCYKYASFNEAPIKICTEGHFICGSCGRGLETCPTCRGSFSNVRPTILHQIIEALAYPCYKVGCGKMLTIKDIHSHELQCNFQEDKDMKYNKNMIQSQNILKHLEDHYSSFYLKPGDDMTELGLCMQCLSVGLFSEDDDLPSTSNKATNFFNNKQETYHNLSKESRNVNRTEVLQSTDNIKAISWLTVNDKQTKEIGVQCNLPTLNNVVL